MSKPGQRVLAELRKMIASGELAAGERIVEIPTAERLQVSRMPVRMALRVLEQEGLLVKAGNRGYTVREVTEDDIAGAVEVRGVLEGLAARQAAERGISEQTRAQLQQCLDEGDRILGKGVLLAEDHLPYQQVNITLHNGILEAAGNPWVKRFATQAQAIPYASDRIILWEDHGIILRSHDDHHRIVNAIIARDGARAEDLMREHVYYAGIILKNNYERLAQAYRV